MGSNSRTDLVEAPGSFSFNSQETIVSDLHGSFSRNRLFGSQKYTCIFRQTEIETEKVCVMVNLVIANFLN